MLGQQIDGLRVVRDGLKPGEKIVVNGLQRVKPGSPLTPTVVPMDADPLAANVAQKEQKVAAADTKKTGTTKE